MKRALIALLGSVVWLAATRGLDAGAETNPADAGPPAPAEGLRLSSEFEDETRVRVEISYPPDGAVIRDSACGVFVAGRAAALRGEAHRFDVAIVVDTSRSTIEPAGADIDGDGTLGKATLGAIGADFETRCTDPGDTILAAEVAAARALLQGLDPRSTRVALLDFSGDAPEDARWLFPRAAARTLEPLTADYARLERALDELLSHEPGGSTHIAAGVELATAELSGRGSRASPQRAEAERIVFFFTDGQPTLPYGPAREADNVREVLLAADRAAEAGIRIHSFAIGREALDGPIASVELAERTGGFFTPVRHPADLVDIVGEVSFANLEDVSLRSLTTGREAELFRETADGSWAGFVRLSPGANRIEVRASASDGSHTERTLEVTSDESGDAPPVPPDLVMAHNALLVECLEIVKEVRLEAERRQAEQVRRQLLEEIARERARAQERASDQRKRLELEGALDETEP